MTLRYVAPAAGGGSDANPGTLGSPYLTIQHSVLAMAAGDTTYVKSGTYRETIDIGAGPQGTSGAQCTIQAYGDGPVIVNPTPAPGTWTTYTTGGRTRVWQLTTASTSVGAIIVNGVPLQEISHGQTTGVSSIGLAGVTDNTGKWYADTTTHVYADMGTVLGAGNPNSANVIVIPKTGADIYGITASSRNYWNITGITLQGAWYGVYWYGGSHNTFDGCNFQFNFKHGLFFDGSDFAVENISVLNSTVMWNFLRNYPGGNNDSIAVGWGGGLSCSYGRYLTVRGCTVHDNWGEGITSYGSMDARTTGDALIENNVVYDNWSVNIYFSDQPNATIRNNIVYAHPIDSSRLLYYGNATWTDNYARLLASVGIGIGNEEGTNLQTDGQKAGMNAVNIYNNIIAGVWYGINQFAEGSTTIQFNGLKNSIIANNTIIGPSTGNSTYPCSLIRLPDNYTPSTPDTQRNTASYIENNIVYGFTLTNLVTSDQPTGALSGITFRNNLYYSGLSTPFSYAGTNYNFTNWKTQLASAGSDTNSAFSDPLLNDYTEFQQSKAAKELFDYNKAKLTSASSPGYDTAFDLSGTFTTDYAGVTRTTWNIGALESLVTLLFTELEAASILRVYKFG